MRVLEFQKPDFFIQYFMHHNYIATVRVVLLFRVRSCENEIKHEK